MITVGCVVIPAYVLYEFRFAKHPVVARRFVFNKSAVVASLVGALYFVSFFPSSLFSSLSHAPLLSSFLTSLFLLSYRVLIHIYSTRIYTQFLLNSVFIITNSTIMKVSVINVAYKVTFYITYMYLNYFSSTQTIALTVFGILGGVLIRITRRVKSILVVSLAICVLDCGLMIHSHGANASDVEIVFSQVRLSLPSLYR